MSEKWPLLDRYHGLTPLEKGQFFRVFELLVFITQKGVFVVLEYPIRDFHGLYLLKKKLEKWPFLDQNHGLTSLKKCQFLDFLIFMFLQPRKAFFVIEYRKRPFPGLYCLRRKVGKKAIFRLIPWINPFGKRSIFRLCELVVFIAYKGVFSFQNIVKDVFLAYIA